MSNKRHRRRKNEPTATFEELDFREQAKSITTVTNNLGKMIDNNVRRAAKENRDADKTKTKRLDQVQRMIDRRCL